MSNRSILFILPALLLPLALATPGRAEPPPPIELRQHLGRPMLFLDGKPDGLPMYASSTGHHNFPLFEKTTARFFPHGISVYQIEVPRATVKPGDFFATSFWVGDTIKPEMMVKSDATIDDQALFVLHGAPDARIMIRLWAREPASWRALHPEDLFVNDEGTVIDTPSLASERYWSDAARADAAIIAYCESRPWADHILGYANFLAEEGTHHPLVDHWLYDHSPCMTARWRAYLKGKYVTVEALRAAYHDSALTFEAAQVPTDKLRGKTADVAALNYWQDAAANQPLRDYLTLGAQLLHEGFAKIAKASHDAASRRRIFLYDGFKQKMMGWSNYGFFRAESPWPLAFPDNQAGSGMIGVAPLFDLPGFDGLITPHRYEDRGLGGIFEPEGMADSMVLRGKLLFAEMDIRTYTSGDPLATARNDREFAVLTWRNLAAALTRGFNYYWMDLNQDWFANPGLHQIIDRQAQVLRDSAAWPHQTVPGIAIVLDDASALETNGDGAYLNEAVMWEQLEGLARCGVPYRIYLLEDLKLDNFPRHRVFYFPNLFKVDDQRLALLKAKVFRDGNVVLWGPGSGISDGKTINTASAERLTGFHLDLWPNVNYPRRVQVQRFDHPITRGMDEGALIGGPLAYGPVLVPRDGQMLGMSLTKYGHNDVGLAVKTFGRGARGQALDPATLGAGDWASVFTAAVPIPATMWRGLAEFAGAHVYCQSNDILLADSTIVAIHSIRSGHKVIRLPQRSRVWDVVTGQRVSAHTSKIEFDLEAPDTRVFRIEPAE